ncbi:MAG: DUF1993 family protein [Pseudobdellovibrionaceae bacterium]
MQIPISEITVRQMTTSLKALKGILKKAHDFSQAKKIDFSVLLQTRLAPDQFAFVRQVQISTDIAKGCIARLTGLENPKFEDNETSYEQLITRIDRTLDFMKQAKPESFQGYETKVIEFPWNPGMYLQGHDFLIQHALPNFFFHVATAYSILRANGVDLGKADFLGEQNWQKK